MAFAAAAPTLLTALGGGSAATGAVLAASAVATVGGAVISARQSRAAGRVADAEAQIAANAEGDAARQREIERKRLLLRAISTQVAEAGAQGIAMDGSAARMAQLDIDDANTDLMIDNANTRSRQAGLRAQGRAARLQGSAQAGATLLDAAARTGLSFVR